MGRNKGTAEKNTKIWSQVKQLSIGLHGNQVLCWAGQPLAVGRAGPRATLEERLRGQPRSLRSFSPIEINLGLIMKGSGKLVLL